MTEVPEQLRQQIDDYMGLFDLIPRWRYDVRIERLSDNEEKLKGLCNANIRYLDAVLTFDPLVTAEDREILLHEVVEVVLWPITSAVNRLVDMIPDELRDHALHVYLDNKEQVITNIARSLCDKIRLKDSLDGQKTTDSPPAPAQS